MRTAPLEPASHSSSTSNGNATAQVSIPMLHSAVALLKLAEMTRKPGANSLFLRTLLLKKCEIPPR